LVILFGKGEYIDENTPVGGLMCGGEKNDEMERK
jgi:hypothetical protein